MPSKPKTLSDELRRAIAGSGLSLYRVAKDSQVDYASLHKFMSGRQSMTLETVDRIAAVLRLSLTQSKKGGR